MNVMVDRMRDKYSTLLSLQYQSQKSYFEQKIKEMREEVEDGKTGEEGEERVGGEREEMVSGGCEGGKSVEEMVGEMRREVSKKKSKIKRVEERGVKACDEIRFLRELNQSLVRDLKTSEQLTQSKLQEKDQVKLDCDEQIQQLQAKLEAMYLMLDNEED